MEQLLQSKTVMENTQNNRYFELAYSLSIHWFFGLGYFLMATYKALYLPYSYSFWFLPTKPDSRFCCG
jgi:hypothetical protein